MRARHFLIICCLGLPAACTTPGVVQLSREYFAESNYYLAFRALEDAAREDPDNQAIRRELDRVWPVYLLWLGQTGVFAGREGEALVHLDELLASDPDNLIAQKWRRKALLKLAGKLVAAGEGAAAEGDLEAALLRYHDALGLVPGFPAAKRGVSKVAEIYQTRHENAQDQYLEGVRKLAERLFHQTEYHMVNALENEPDFARAESRRQHARKRIAEIHLTRAKKMEDGGFYTAALKTYEECKQVLGPLAEIDQSISRMKREVAAEKLTRAGESALFRGKFQKSVDLFDKAYDMSELERPYISQMLVLVRDRRSDRRYQIARDREFEHKFEFALAIYKEIEEDNPGFQDVKARISELESTIDVAGKAWSRGREAEKKGDLHAAIDAYEEALLVYPGYADLEPKVKELKAKLEAKS